MLQGCRVLVTGAGQGNGAAIASGLAALGAEVILADIQDAKASGVARQIHDAGRVATSARMDVTDAADCLQAARQIDRDGGCLDHDQRRPAHGEPTVMGRTPIGHDSFRVGTEGRHRRTDDPVRQGNGAKAGRVEGHSNRAHEPRYMVTSPLLFIERRVARPWRTRLSRGRTVAANTSPIRQCAIRLPPISIHRCDRAAGAEPRCLRVDGAAEKSPAPFNRITLYHR